MNVCVILNLILTVQSHEAVCECSAYKRHICSHGREPVLNVIIKVARKENVNKYCNCRRIRM